MVARDGIEGFYGSREARFSCCHVRKVEPLNRALVGAGGWMTGLRADRSVDRAAVELVIVDAERGLLKLNPLIDWTREAAAAFAALHAKELLSIGCAPCTGAIAPGEPERAGRWWWEGRGKKECGLHVQRPAAPGRRKSDEQ